MSSAISPSLAHEDVSVELRTWMTVSTTTTALTTAPNATSIATSVVGSRPRVTTVTARAILTNSKQGAILSQRIDRQGKNKSDNNNSGERYSRSQPEATLCEYSRDRANDKGSEARKNRQDQDDSRAPELKAGPHNSPNSRSSRINEMYNDEEYEQIQQAQLYSDSYSTSSTELDPSMHDHPHSMEYPNGDVERTYNCSEVCLQT
ncbi:hypothetical protein B0O80DRAFT_449455 [Mortierella sp. GBAus27b]|nr:hypothetical protein B0O80DRAFT_449455 [Mortierella sp. GBAus27b]